ncbi:MAG: PD40 domain-containing protein [Phycisphaerales bacterium]|nr:MAG: PD40 domain-containing protein [Phycisphaerales bacterium]
MRSAILAVVVVGMFVSAAKPAADALLGEANEVVFAPSDPAMSTSDKKLRRVVLQAAKASSTSEDLLPLTIEYPLDGGVFPPEMAAATFVWSDPAAEADTWLIEVVCSDASDHLYVLTQGATPPRARDDDPRTLSQAAAAYEPPARVLKARRWMPSPGVWERIKSLSRGRPATVTIAGFRGTRFEQCLSRGRIRLTTSDDAVEASIFFRDVPLPFRHVLENLKSIRWRLGEVSSYKPPTLLTDMKVCGNCHSFTHDGKTLAMDVDYGSDKGSYVIAAIEPQTVLEKDKVISWSDYRRQDKEPTFGLLSQISPDGRYVISTVKDRSVFSPVEDLHYSQRFFPVTGILVVYDRKTKEFFALAGADDRHYVQSNPVWSPDGQTILFARSKCYKLPNLKDPSSALVTREEVSEFFEGGKKFRYDIYRIPFNEGKGGQAKPVPGASENGKSNYFPRFSPDGKWIVFCQSDSFMLLQPDSTLYIMPSAGGKPKKMRCNFPGKMNSWHSWSPDGKWLVFASKAGGPFTQLWLTHIDADGNDTPPVLLEHFTAADRAANIPEFVNARPGEFSEIRQEFADYYTHYRAGALLEQRHEYARAIEELHRALDEKPDHVESLYLLASCLARLDRETEAIPYARKAVRLAPTGGTVHGLLGALLNSSGRYSEALTHLEAAYAANPGDVSVASNLAWALATSPEETQRNGPRAVELAEWACKATAHKSPPLLDTLATAYAEVGQFERAVRTTLQAIEIVRRNPKASTATLESRLKLYRASMPYRESAGQ